MSSAGVFSQTLREITSTKLEELAKKRESFELRKRTAIERFSKIKDPIDRLQALAEGTKVCFSVTTKDGKIVRGSSSNPKLESKLSNLDRFLDQARFDPAINKGLTSSWEQTLLEFLHTQSLKYQYADLYGKLTVEWLTTTTTGQAAPPGTELEDSEDFEEISVKDKLEARRIWEREVFTEAQVDHSAIGTLLNQLFRNEGSKTALDQLRKDVSEIEDSFSTPDQFNPETLHWVIKGLLTSDGLAEEKRQVLRDFQTNPTILTELSDVLNMRVAALDDWSWGSEVTVEARRQLNGKYDIHMREDLLQTLFLQYIGVTWSVGIKKALMKFQANADAWKDGLKRPSPLEKQRRQWYLSSSTLGLTVKRIQSLSYRAGYFVSQLRDQVDQNTEVEQGQEEADFGMAAFADGDGVVLRSSAAVRSFPPGALSGRGMRKRRIVKEASPDSSDEDEEADDDDLFLPVPTDEDLAPYKPKNPMDAKQRLLHLLSSDMLVKTTLVHDFTCFRSQYTAWNQSLPHATAATVMSFLGVSKRWLNFLRSFLEAPLKFSDGGEKAQIRRRGMPSACVLSDVISEMVLFCLDYTVNQQTEGEIIWRLKDDLWFWSTSHEKSVRAWKVIETFNKVMGVKLDRAKSGAVRVKRKSGTFVSAELDRSLPQGDIRWGMLVLDGATACFTIDQNLVDKHIEELRRQLKDKQSSIFSWIQAYSTYASVFFTTNFGKPANCFGRKHLDMMLLMHERIQRTLFTTTTKNKQDQVASVVDWLKVQINQRFGVEDVPDGFLFFPATLGGLEVKSPFIGLLQLRESVTKDPLELLETFVDAERKEYDRLKKRYLERKPWEYTRRSNDYRPDDPQQFMSFEEYSKYREELNYGFSDQLVDVYETLLKEPIEETVDNDIREIHDALQCVRTTPDQPATITSWWSMNSYWKWVTMLYGPQMMQRFGGLEVVDAGLLPMGMVTMFRSGRVKWQE